MGDSGGRRALPALCALAVALAGLGCGKERQDAGAPAGEFGLDVTAAAFPAEQRIAEPVTLRLRVENTGRRTVPDLAVTVETDPGETGAAPASFGRAQDDPTLASSTRPVWVLDDGPAGGESAYAGTWAVGPLASGESRTLKWELTAVRAGRHTVAWRLAPALEGDVELTSGRTRGRFDVTISDDPVPARVDGDGDVVRGEEGG